MVKKHQLLLEKKINSDRINKFAKYCTIFSNIKTTVSLPICYRLMIFLGTKCQTRHIYIYRLPNFDD